MGSTLVITKDMVTGGFEATTKISLENKKTNQIEIEIGGGMFSKPEAKYQIPEELSSYTFEAIEKEEESVAKLLLSLGGAVVGGVGAVASYNDSSKSDTMKLATTGAYGAMAAGAVRMNTKSLRTKVLVNLQFTDQRILCLEMTAKEWKKFDEDYCIVNFLKYQQETEEQKEALSSQIQLIRDNFSQLPATDQRDAGKQINGLLKQLPALDKDLERRKKIAQKRKIPVE